jgi:hypothetical protein
LLLVVSVIVLGYEFGIFAVCVYVPSPLFTVVIVACKTPLEKDALM